MADKRIFNLTEATTAGDNDLLALDNSNFPETKKIKVSKLKAADAQKLDITSLYNLTGTTNTTGSTIHKGTFFYLNGSLSVALADIAPGATFTFDTNYVATTVGDELTDVKQTLTQLGSNSTSAQLVTRIINEAGTWSLVGSSTFDSTTTLSDIIAYLNDNDIKADKAIVYSNKSTNTFNDSLPTKSGSIVEITPTPYGKAMGQWTRGYIKVINYANGDTYIAGLDGGTIGTFHRVGFYNSPWELLATIAPTDTNHFSGDIKVYKNSLLRRIHIDASAITAVSSASAGTAYQFVYDSNIVVPTFAMSTICMAKDPNNNYIPVIIGKNATNTTVSLTPTLALPANTTINIKFEYSY